MAEGPQPKRFTICTGTGTTYPNADYERHSLATTASPGADKCPGCRPNCDRHCPGVTDRASTTTTTGCRGLTGNGRVV
jgi:hypothetical protein